MKRKLLAMVLSMAMTLSLGTFAANAATPYSDAADIQFEEAAAVLTAAGVFSGTGDGRFQPKTELDRASAAKIITYLSVGSVAAENMEAGEAPFYDVPASHWAAGYVAYCKNAGIIAGDGSGNFNPNAPVNASQFAKMLLVVLGYDADIELLVGANWSINVSKLAAKNGILDDVSDAIGSNLTREVAAKMSFNSLFSDTYEYQSKGDTIDLGNGQKIVLGASPVSTQSNLKHDYRNTKGSTTLTDEVMQLTEKLFGEKLKKGSATTDAMERDGFDWQWDGKTVYTAYEDASLSYISNMTSESNMKTVVNDLKAKGVTVSGTFGSYVVNGEGDTVEVYLNGESAEGDGGNSLDAILSNTAAGKLAEFYISENKLTKVCFTQYTLGEVTGAVKYVESNGAEYTEYTIDEYGAFKVYTKVVADEKSEGEIPSGLAEGDIVTFVATEDKDGDEFVYVYATTKMTGIQTAFSDSNKTSTIGGQKYNWGEGVEGFVADDAKKNDSKEEREFYLDVNGLLVKVSDVEEKSGNYAIITGIVKDGLSDAARATLVLTDGTSKTVNISSFKKKGGDSLLGDINETASENAEAFENFFVSYSVDSNGAYKLTTLHDDAVEGDRIISGTISEASDTEILKKGAPSVTIGDTTLTIGKSTKIIVRNDDNEVSVYTGSANMPTIKADGETVNVALTGLVDLDAEKNPKTILNTLWISIESGASTDDSSSNKEYAIFFEEGGDVTAVGDDDVIVYRVGSDAQVKTINLDYEEWDANQAELGTLFQLKSVNSSGVVTEMELVEAKDGEIVIGAIESVGDGVIAIDGFGAYTYDDDTVVTIADLDNNSVRKGNLDTIKTDKIVKVYVFVDENKAEKVYVVYQTME